ncbi:MBL fold metallo-hydrolase [Govanella unica]|uniref:MBL fold metallo-hydrolase n=1 Tax=Govanella unica TaxID=2975056 RepID=A0A9X3TYY9_9PROT|nr:MBL fold metallo-hydrolase [Govania unica]MDA5194049.1 MBL fold metallo-hydrolase [Govania unica]
MSKWQYTKGLHEIGNGNYAYLLPNGSWGWSNAGLIIDGDQSLLVDTLFDEKLTAEMLAVMKDATGIGGGDVTTLVNTHANGDHTFGNRLVTNAEIIASKEGSEEMDELPPQAVAEMMRNAPNMGEVGEFLIDIFKGFDFEGITLKKPTRTFHGKLDLKVGHKDVHLIEVGPAHTRGDTLVYVPEDKVIYTGDILFIGGTPIIWAGPVGNWIKACEYMLTLDVDVVVPGHGPITDKAGVRQVRDYLSFVHDEARKRFDAGMSFEDAAFDIALGEFGKWTDTERLVVNIYSLYKEFRGVEEHPDYMALFGIMSRFRRRERMTCEKHDHAGCAHDHS